VGIGTGSQKATTIGCARAETELERQHIEVLLSGGLPATAVSEIGSLEAKSSGVPTAIAHVMKFCRGDIVNGPKCYCEHQDWFVSRSVYRCANCDRTRKKT
jgi:hypothetical protein